MAIEKWRQAKTGDKGRVCRFRLSERSDWKIGVLTTVDNASNEFERDWGPMYSCCEVLEAYLSDEEVERLAYRLSMQNYCAEYVCEDFIHQHFVSEVSDEKI